MLIQTLDSIALLAALTGLMFLLVGWKQIAGPDIRTLLIGLLSLTAFYAFCLWVEWSGFSDELDTIEDFAGALMPMLWAFVFYAYIQYAGSLDLRKSEENLRITLNSIGDGMIATDTQGRVTHMNPVAEELTGWLVTEARGRQLTEILQLANAETGAMVENPTEQVLKSGAVVGLANHTVLIARDDRRHHIADSAAPISSPEGEILGVVLVFRDVSDEYRMRRQIAESEERLRAIFDSAQDGIYLKDTAHRYSHCNESMARLLGRRREEIIGLSDRELFPPDQAEDIRSLDGTVLAGQPVRGVYLRIFGDTVLTVDCSAAPVRDTAGHVVGLCGVLRDMTAEAKLREEKARLDEQHRQVQKMEAIGRLAGGVAHDLNNLLSPIIGYSEMLLEDMAATDDKRGSVNEVLRAAYSSRDLVHRLLAFSRKQPLAIKPVELNRSLVDIEKLLRRTIKENIDIRVAPAPNQLVVEADPGQIEQVIMNLAVNAADAMPEGGRLVLETQWVEVDDLYVASHPDVTPGRYAMLAVSDTGCGMDAETRGRIFEPFYSSKGERGTGLGLATVYGIVTQHRGHIWVYSEPGNGATFKVYLPLSAVAQVEEQPVEKPLGTLTGSETILLAEDNELVRQLTRSILERKGYKVLVAKGGREALTAAERHDQPIHLLLTDVVMPEINGRELYTKAVKAHPELKVLFMSGYTDNVIAPSGILDEGTAFIQKPFSVQALAQKVREVIDG